MARILYAVCGVGLGHASRSSIIIKALRKNHKLKIVSYSDGYDFLKKHFKGIVKLKWFNYRFKGNRIDWLGMLSSNLPLLPKFFVENYSTMKKLVSEFNPDVIVSDFDSNALFAGKLFHVPVILVSNMHLAQYVKPKLKIKEKIQYKLTDERIVSAYFCADHYLITSILKPKEAEKNRHFFYPIIDLSLAKKKPKKGKHFLVYMSAQYLQEVLPILEKFQEKKFVVYGLGKKKSEKNIAFRNFSRSGWEKDILSCKALLCHGGLLSISEAVVLKKPVYVFSPKDWFERFHNGYMVQMQGFGKLEEEPTLHGLKEFFENLREYEKKLKEKNIKPDNSNLLGKLEELVELEASRRGNTFL